MTLKTKKYPGHSLVILLLIMVWANAGCILQKGPQGETLSVVSPDFFGIGEDIAGQLSAGLRRPLVGNKRLIMTTVVNIDDLYQTSRFGRTLTETLATGLFRQGFGVVEIRKSTDLLIKGSSGELMLTRDASLLAREYETEAVAVGTYAVTPNSVIVNVRLLDTGSQDVLSVAGLEIQRSKNINYLLTMSGGHLEAGLSGFER